MRTRRSPPLTPDYRQRLHEFSRSLALIVDEEALHPVVAAHLEAALGLERIVVFLRHGEDDAFRAATWRGVDEGAAAAATFAADGRLARWLKVNEEALVLSESPSVVAFLEPRERATLESLGAAACFPLVAMSHLTGFLVLAPGVRANGGGLGPADRELLAALAAQSALAFENAALLRERKARLKRMYRAERLATAGELAAGAAHEIRNPLAAVRSAIQYLRRDYPDGSERAALIDDVLAEVDRIDGIVDGLLSFARPREPAFQTLDLVELVRQTVGLVANRARGQGVRTRVEASAPVRLDADPDLIKQLLLNLLLNALQAMPGGGELRVSTAGGGRVVELRVSDSGEGIPRENLERIFDPFFTTKPEGTGLGLSICHGIVERHRGEIEVSNEPVAGTTIAVRLPRRQGR